MRKEMGMYHSSLSCERISKSLHNCFGLKTGRTYETESGNRKNLSTSPLQDDNSSLGSRDQIDVSQPKQKASRKSLRSSKGSSCCKGCSADKDDFSYDICNQSTDSQVNSRLPNTTFSNSFTSPVTQSRRHSDCPRDRKSSGDIPAMCTAVDVTNKQTSRLSTEALVEPKQTIVQVNGNEILVKTVTNRKESDENLARKSSNHMNNHQVKAPASTLRSNSLTETDGFVPSSTKSEETNDAIVSKVTKGEEDSTKRDDDVTYFHNLVTAETERLNESIEKWNKILLGGNSHCPTVVCDEIRTVIGQTRLVISERFTQFSKLVNRAEGRSTPTSDQRPVLISDLQGFWDMIYFQVQDLDTKFKSLDKLRENQWKSSIPSPQEGRKSSVKTNKKPKSAQKKQPAKKKAPASEEDRKRREAARKRLAEARKALAQRNQVEHDAEGRVETSPVICSTSNFVTENPNNHTKEETVSQVKTDISDTNSSRKRPESLVDALSCAVTINQVNADNASLSSISSTSMVH